MPHRVSTPHVQGSPRYVRDRRASANIGRSVAPVEDAHVCYPASSSSSGFTSCWALAFLERVPRQGRLPPSPLALAIRTRTLDRDTDQGAPVSRHRSAIVVPIGMFASEPAIIVHERFHRLR
jgi:hypothetical protein